MDETTPRLSERAAKRISEIAARQNTRACLRLSVLGGGCSGFQYRFALEETVGEGDMTIEGGGAALVIDKESLAFLKGAEIDYTQDLIGASFQVKNPNAVSSCGCGESFSV